MREYKTLSRTSRYQKRRNNKRKLFFFVSLGAIFFVILFSLIIFGNKDNNSDKTVKHQENESEEMALPEEKETDKAEDATIEKEESDNEESEIENLIEDVEVQQVDSTDDNVIVAFRGDWPPIGTVQEGTHTTNYKDGSDDRIEIKRAVSMVTRLDENDMIEHWVGNNGEQKVIAIASDREQSEFYRVYLTWIDQEGWQVTKVERIKEYVKS